MVEFTSDHLPEFSEESALEEGLRSGREFPAWILEKRESVKESSRVLLPHSYYARQRCVP